MKVKNIVKQSAKFLGLDKIVDMCDGVEIDESEIEEELENLLVAINMTNNHVASNYIELINIKSIKCDDGVIKFSDISDSGILDIKNIYKGNEVVDYKLVYNGIRIANGVYDIEYSYFPEDVGIDDEINYYIKMSEMLFSQGVVGEYLFIKGDFEEGYAWDKRFKDLLYTTLRHRKTISMPKRRWY